MKNKFFVIVSCAVLLLFFAPTQVMATNGVSGEVLDVTDAGYHYNYHVWASESTTNLCSGNYYNANYYTHAVGCNSNQIESRRRCKGGSTPSVCGKVYGCEVTLEHTCSSGYSCYVPGGLEGYCRKGCTTCASYSGQCGDFSDGCGGTITCACGSGQYCDAGACTKAPTKLMVRKGGKTYAVDLVPVGDSEASKVRIQTGAGVKALRKMP